MKFNSIILIGMAGTGKSTIGKLLAKKLNLKFFDCDEYIEKQEKMKIHQVIYSLGEKRFLEIEKQRMLELNQKNCVLTPGGSIVLSKDLMNYLKKTSLLIFLDTPFKIIKERVRNGKNRGIIGLKQKSLKKVFEERLPLYQKCAHIIINCHGKSKQEIVEDIIIRFGQRKIFR